MINIDKARDAITDTDTFQYGGKVTRVVGMLVEGVLPNARIGATCRFEVPHGEDILAEVVGLKEDRAVLMPLGQKRGLTVGTPIKMTSGEVKLKVGRGCLGRVLDGLGNPIDGKGRLRQVDTTTIRREPLNPLNRRMLGNPIDLGVRAINGLLTVAEGQRMAVISSAGVGKSTLLGMMARNTSADVIVVGLIGERGREVREFVERDLNLAEMDSDRISVVAATSDQSPALRLRAAFAATTIAEHFRDQGQRVLLLMDSLTRVVRAQREIGLSVGEPPATRGYPPSAFSVIPNLVERTGAHKDGSITAIYTTLIEGDEADDPVSEAVRATTDGHITLSRELAEAGQYPAIDITKSISRMMEQVVDSQHLEAARDFRATVHNYREAEELVNLGAYERGSNPEFDRALAKSDDLREYLTQLPSETVSLEESVEQLRDLMGQGGDQQSRGQSSHNQRPRTYGQNRQQSGGGADEGMDLDVGNLTVGG